jgi:hypothetical protein
LVVIASRLDQFLRQAACDRFANLRKRVAQDFRNDLSNCVRKLFRIRHEAPAANGNSDSEGVIILQSLAYTMVT